jgi:hypothetical protein
MNNFKAIQGLQFAVFLKKIVYVFACSLCFLIYSLPSLALDEQADISCEAASDPKQSFSRFNSMLIQVGLFHVNQAYPEYSNVSVRNDSQVTDGQMGPETRKQVARFCQQISPLEQQSLIQSMFFYAALRQVEPNCKLVSSVSGLSEWIGDQPSGNARKWVETLLSTCAAEAITETKNLQQYFMITLADIEVLQASILVAKTKAEAAIAAEAKTAAEAKSKAAAEGNAETEETATAEAVAKAAAVEADALAAMTAMQGTDTNEAGYSPTPEQRKLLEPLSPDVTTALSESLATIVNAPYPNQTQFENAIKNAILLLHTGADSDVDDTSQQQNKSIADKVISAMPVIVDIARKPLYLKNHTLAPKDDCNCVENFHYDNTMYHFYPGFAGVNKDKTSLFAIPTEQSESKAQEAPQKSIDYSIVSRIAFQGLGINVDGEIQNGAAIEDIYSSKQKWNSQRDAFITQAHKYYSKADLVLEMQEWQVWGQASLQRAIDTVDSNILNTKHRAKLDGLFAR